MTDPLLDGGHDDRSAFVDDGDRNGSNQSNRGVRVRWWLIGILCVLAVALFAADRFIVLVLPNLAAMEDNRSEQSVRTLEEDVRTLFDTYGIQADWIRTSAVSLPGHERFRSVWRVRTPVDIPLASINFELNRIARRYDSRAFAVEDAKSRQVSVHIRIQGLVRYSLLFTPDAGLSRLSGSITLLLDGLQHAADDDIEAYLASRDPLACILVPSRDAQDVHDRLRIAGKDVVLHVHLFPGNGDGTRFSVGDGMSEKSLRNKARVIAKGFPGTRAFYVTSERAFASAVAILDDELERLGLARLETAALNYIDRTSEFSTLSSRMNDLAVIAARDGMAAGVVELRTGTLETVSQDISRLRKKGFDFIPIHRYMQLLAGG